MTFFREMLYPTRCPGCDEILYQKDVTTGFCGKCEQQIIRVTEPSCIKCGKPIQHSQEEYCYDCKKKHHYFVQNKAVFVYRGPMKEAMYRLKYANRRCYAKILSREIYDKYKDWMIQNHIQAIIPIPMYLPKQRRRGYNQAAILAKELSKYAKLPSYSNLVYRVKNSTPQKELNDVERKNNLKNAFKIRKSEVKLKKILLIDDIYTTGSTMDAVSKVLLDGGIQEVYGLSVCIGEGRE